MRAWRKWVEMGVAMVRVGVAGVRVSVAGDPRRNTDTVFSHAVCCGSGGQTRVFSTSTSPHVTQVLYICDLSVRTPILE